MNYDLIYQQIHQIFLEIPRSKTEEMNKIYLSKSAVKFDKDALDTELRFLRKEYMKKLQIIREVITRIRKEE